MSKITSLSVQSYNVKTVENGIALKLAVCGMVRGKCQALFSLVPHLMSYREPKLRELRGMLEGRSIEASRGWLDTFNSVDFAQRSADTAFDCRADYDGLEQSIAAHRVNVVDTLNEQSREQFHAEALAAFDARVAELRAKEVRYCPLSYFGLPLVDAMARQRDRLQARMTSYAERGEFSALVTKEMGGRGVFWFICIRKGSEVIDRDMHYSGAEFAERRALAMLDKVAPPVPVAEPVAQDLNSGDACKDAWHAIACAKKLTMFNEAGAVLTLDLPGDDEGFVFVMYARLPGIHMRHTLAASVTNVQRLCAHWTGFVESVRAAAASN